MARAKQGDSVKVHYTGRLTDGTVFDSSRGRQPLAFQVGSGQVIAGFDGAVDGMEPGESKTVTIPADQAYGPHREDLVMVVDRANVPPDLDPEVGMQLELRQANGQPVPVTITAVTDTTLTLDANSELAGKDLVFDIELVEIR